jgi:hypothetical protein
LWIWSFCECAKATTNLDFWCLGFQFGILLSHSYLSCTPILLLNDIQINSSPEKFPWPLTSMQHESKHESGTFNCCLDLSKYIGITVLIVSWFAKFMFYSGSWACFIWYVKAARSTIE